MIFKSYFVRRAARKLRNHILLQSMRDIKLQFNSIKNSIMYSKENKHEFAYLAAERDGFKRSPEEYWLETEKTIEGMYTWLIQYEKDHKETLKETRMLIRKQI